ncbi:MAG: low molecular weight protein-tyrosine phosphatase [Frankiaceae bacterium]|jgi:protein-tyrosine phosphatase|nr:low molecular weight protein-tyrosine phosphatase [Frankiaceae bacterium]
MSDPFDILMVCTGNICRSPTAELVAAHRLPPESFRVHSAGTYGLEGYPIEPGAARPLQDLGIAYDAFRARRLTAEQVEGADLVLVATREHRTAVVTLVPSALPRTFTLREFARLVEHVEGLPGDDLAERGRALVAAAAAQRGRVWVPPEADDIDDPYGLGPKAYDRAAAEIAEALRLPLERLAGV